MLFFLSFFTFNVILNVVKNLISVSLCQQILRDAQDDRGILDTLKKFKGANLQRKSVKPKLLPLVF